ncbi:hypothetical protein HYR99_20725 [Candidatus Poribacteria bacterium]|nr:hypothetical protein [Candidatus Poribacteria bacterium]
MATDKQLIPTDGFLKGWTDEELREWVRAYLADAEPIGGCDACRFEDPFSEELCTIPDISPEDFNLGVSGINCSRFQPRE